MLRYPMLLLLRVFAPVSLLAVVLYPKCGARQAYVPPESAVWATDIAPDAPPWLQMGLRAAGPLPGQKRPPCTPVRERELVGACWIGTEHTPPCPEGVYEVGGRCVVPVQASAKVPTSAHE